VKIGWQGAIALLFIGVIVFYVIDEANGGDGADDLLAPVQSVINEIESFFGASSGESADCANFPDLTVDDLNNASLMAAFDTCFPARPN